MKIKSVSFEDYALARVGNEDKSYGEIIDIAWKSSNESLKIKKYCDDAIFFVAIGALSFVVAKSFTIYPPMPLVGDFEPTNLVAIKEAVSDIIKSEHISMFNRTFLDSFAKLLAFGL